MQNNSNEGSDQKLSKLMSQNVCYLTNIQKSSPLFKFDL